MNAAKKLRASVLAIPRSDADSGRAFLSTATIQSADGLLAQLTVGVGQLAAYRNDLDWTRAHLRRILGFAAGWIVCLGEKQWEAKVNAERDRQEELFRTGKLTFNCSSLTVCVQRKLRVLVEEVGEVAEAIDTLEQVRNTNRTKAWAAADAHLLEELIQVAAVAVGWLEALETSTKGTK
ncbi:MAG TPA: hypothetical protein VG347_05135 [Verrucomicrobiae bacterium]|nr:hypothetical protein [Verrucomicrobiae bacterium]